MRIEGKAVFVPGVIPGETVRVRVVDDRKRWARAELVEVIEPVADRVEPPCPYVPDCGGCDLQHVTPDGQRALKTRVVTEQLERLGRLVDPPVAACLPVGPDTHYRTHARMHADPDGRLGFHRAGSNDVVAVDTCLVLSAAAQQVRDQVGDDTGAAEVEVRAHAGSGTSVAVLHPGPGGLEMPDNSSAGEPAGSRAGPTAVPVVLAQPDGTMTAFRGDGELVEEVAGFTFWFDAGSFFQVSPQGAGALVEHVLAAAADVDGAHVWDLYAGVGLFSLPLARAGAVVTAVEGNRAAVDWLNHNAAANDLGERVTAVPDDVVGFVEDDHVHDPPDVVILDPPRTGAGPDVCERLAALRPATIVYVACDPAALARDARTLTEAGFRLTSVQPLDLFPMTHHVEAVATFVA